jgi:hypothetical protein
MKKETKKKKPSYRIKELAQEIHNKGIDPGFTGYNPDIGDYISAIIVYLDEERSPIKVRIK